MSDDPFVTQPDSGSAATFSERPTLENKNYLEELVGEGKKFKTPEELAKGKAEADLFIKSLLDEMKEVKDELNKRMTVEDLMNSLKGTREQTTMTNGDNFNTSENTHTSHGDTGTNSLDLETIRKALKDELAQEKEKARRQANVAEVVNKLREQHGDNVSAYLNTKAKELNVDITYLRELAEDKPSVFYQLVGNSQTSNDPFRSGPVTPPRSQVTTGVTPTKSYGEHKTKSYYEQLKLKDKKAYFSPQVRVQMHKDALALGESFFDT